MSLRTLLRWVGWACLLFGMVSLSIWAAGVYRSARALAAQAEGLETLLEAKPAEMDLAGAERQLQTLRTDLDDLRRRVGEVPRWGAACAWLPRVGPLLDAAPQLLALADALTDLGLGIIDDAVAAKAAIVAGTPAPRVVVDTVSGLQPQLEGLGALLGQAKEAYGAIDTQRMPDRLRKPLERVGTLLPMLEDGLAWVAAAPRLLGTDLPQTYLVLLLNEDELRPGGGFITAVAQLRVADGALIDVGVMDSYAADDFTKPYPDPPTALGQFLGIDLWVFRDSNWSPDFPATIATALPLYRPEVPMTIDGVIALDQAAVRQLVDAIGGLALPGLEHPLDGKGVFGYIYANWAPADGVFDRQWWAHRKMVLAELAEAALQRVAEGSIDWQALMTEGVALMYGRHVQVYSAVPAVQALLAGAMLDGAVRQDAGDFLMVVEANVGFNKASGKIGRAYSYAVDLTQAAPRATLTLTYTHTSNASVACVPEADYEKQYAQMMDRCYWAYLRVLETAGTALLSGTRHPIPAAQVASGEAWPGDPVQLQSPEAGRATLAQAFLLPTSDEVVVTFEVSLPEGVVMMLPSGSRDYRLVWQKQPGSGAVPVRVELRLPAGAVLWSSTPQAAVDRAGKVVFEGTLDTDLEITLRYGVAREAEE